MGQGWEAVGGALGADGGRDAAHTGPRPDRSFAPTPALRRQQIKFQVALANALMHTKGYAGHRSPARGRRKAAWERARLLIEQAEALGEPLEDPLLLFSVLYGFWVMALNGVAGDGKVVQEPAGQFLALAEKQEATVPLMVGHRSWACRSCTQATSPKVERTLIELTHSTIPRHIVR